MDTKSLKYFLEVANNLSISKASKKLYVTQPTISISIKQLENELNVKLFERTKKGMSLTDEGYFLKIKALDILSLVEKTKSDININDRNITGTINLSCGETEKLHYLIKIIEEIRLKHPDIKLRIVSGDSENTFEELSKGTSDCGFIFGVYDTNKFEGISLNLKDEIVCILNKSDTLSKKSFITKDDIINKPLIVSRRFLNNSIIEKWFGCKTSKLNIAGSYSLLYNATIMVKENMGLCLGLSGIANLKGTELVERPLSPAIFSDSLNLIWKKNTLLNSATKIFIDSLKKTK